MYQIIFAGGIHGVGKSTLCRELASELKLSYLSASELLKWKDLNAADKRNKKVIDIPDMQDRLINGLGLVVEPDKKYILDGHFCLFNKDGKVTKIPIETFEKINPSILILITGDARDIALALSKRDDRAYNPTDLDEMQNLEISYASEVAVHLNIPLIIHSKENNQISDLINPVNESFT